MTDENRYDDPMAPDEEPAPVPGEEAGPGSQITPDELTRVEQLDAPGRVRAAWGWTRRAARTTQPVSYTHLTLPTTPYV